MKKYSISITAHFNFGEKVSDSMEIKSMVYETTGNAFPDLKVKRPFLNLLCGMMPILEEDWCYDDGDDVYNTDYAQYVAYTDINPDNYILATLQEIKH